MIDNFAVADLDVERLLSEWRWLCPDEMKLVARNVYGDLFLRDKDGGVFWLDVGVAGSKKLRIAKANSVSWRKPLPRKKSGLQKRK